METTVLVVDDSPTELRAMQAALAGRGYTVVTAVDGEQAWRVWLLERELIRSRFLRAGVPVSRWNGDRPLAAAVEELASTR